MAIIRVQKDKDNPYVMINKKPLNNSGLSWKAKGLLSFLLSLPDDWEINIEHLKTVSTDGKESTAKGIQELMKAGYIVRQNKREKGQFKGFDYSVYEKRLNNVEIEPKPENPTTVKPTTENQSQLNNDLTNKDYTNILYIVETWNNQDVQKHKESTIKRNVKKTHFDIINDYGIDITVKGIINYSHVINSSDYYFNHRWSFWDFIKRGLDKFVDSATPFDNWKTNNGKNDQRAQSVLDRLEKGRTG